MFVHLEPCQSGEDKSLHLLQKIESRESPWKITYYVFLLEQTRGKWGSAVSSRTTATLSTLCGVPAMLRAGAPAGATL